jgi:hypothetical protein
VEPGAILLLHDGNIPAERLVLTVRGLLAELQANGYRVVRLDRVLAPAGATDSPAAATPRVGAALPSAVGGAQFGGQARGAP